MKVLHSKQKWCYFFTLFFILFTLAGCSSISNAPSDTKKTEATVKTPSGTLSVQYIDVGQGNSVLLQTDGHSMLIDGGDRSHSSKVVSYLKKQGIETLDYVIATHYDADHLSGLVGVLNQFSIETVFDPDYKTDTKIFASYIKMKQEKNIKSIHPTPGEQYTLGDGTFTILAPNSSHYSDVNDYSIAILFQYGKNKFIFAGDAGIESEYEILENGIDVSCDVYLASHHGSQTATSEGFLKAMSPSCAVISVGKDNSYGHPHKEIIQQFKETSIPVYRTDQLGTITAVSNGTSIDFSFEKDSKKPNTFATKKDTNSDKKTSNKTETSNQLKNSKQASYIGNINSKKIHLSTCSGLPLKKNRAYFATYEESIQAGYSPCKICHPELEDN